ncbi:MAG TPA: cobalamin biosynthesis protein CbiX, partial [Turneriella sp.]|nr:cobalamin biosynthesis protein CbiX [Turneriella sp.]
MKTNIRFLISLFALAAVVVTPTASKQTKVKKKVGLLLVNHGSRSAAWRASLMQLEKNVRSEILAEKHFTDVRTA